MSIRAKHPIFDERSGASQRENWACGLTWVAFVSGSKKRGFEAFIFCSCQTSFVWLELIRLIHRRPPKMNQAINKPKNWYCQRFKKVLVSHAPQMSKLTRTRCKMWDCRFCAVVNRKRWRAALLAYLNSVAGKEKVWSFNTITVPRAIHKHANAEFRMSLSLAFIRKNWDKLIKRLKREYGNFSYVRVLEQHQSGVLHIHLLSSFHHTDLHVGIGKKGASYSYSPSFKRHLTETGFGFITNSQNILDEHGESANAGLVVGYITKYMTKQSDAFAQAVAGKRVRRVLTSRDIGSPKQVESEEQWFLRDGVYLFEVLIDESYGRIWVDLNTGAIITLDDFPNGDIYPEGLE